MYIFEPHILNDQWAVLNRNSIILQSSVVGVTDIVYVFLRIAMFVSACMHTNAVVSRTRHMRGHVYVSRLDKTCELFTVGLHGFTCDDP